MQKISQFILISVVLSFFGGYTTTVFSNSEAQSWGSIFPNKNFLSQFVNLSGICISYNGTKWKTRYLGRRVHISGISAIINTKDIFTKANERNTIGLRVIPYVVSKKTRGKLFTVIAHKEVTRKNFNKFYPVCTQSYNHQARLEPKFNKFYPLILLHVDSKKNRKSLEKRIKSLKWHKLDFLAKPIKTTTVSTVGDLLKKVFSKKQAKFLKGLRFNVCVELIDEKEGNLKFQVGNFGDSSPCKSALSKQSQNRTTENLESDNLSASSDNSVSTCEQSLQKDVEAIQCQETNQKLVTCKNQTARLQGEINQFKTDIAQVEQEKFDVIKEKDFLNMQLMQFEKANSGIDKLLEKNSRFQSQIGRLKQDNQQLKSKCNQAALFEETLARLRTENQELKAVIKLTNTTQRRGEKTSPWLTWLETKNDRLTSQVEQLTKQLAETKKLVETNPEIFRLDAEILQLETENMGLQRQVEKLNKQLVDVKQQANERSVVQP
ncbi:hypothetical protein [Candidatus Parabeggiatoa sp. HSG14]|uniref:hypothetical protein n=1 Tax=Candidatus Parabeggiatoa sp. HSG14 TaxID=3055593 RepID=UPI0025A6F599|nr:hypothetical protein [Thiotrichales bacterium HSG14]